MWDMSEGELAEYIAANLGAYEGKDDYQIGFCQNCNKELEIEQAKAGKLYCSEKCNQIAGTVRYGRKALKDGRWHSPDVQEAIRMRIAHILGGGYPEKARRVPPEMRAFIFTRDNHTCVLCGAPADTIDHINGSVNTPDNLRALCRSCNMARVKMIPATPEQTKQARAFLARIQAKEPLRICDDEEIWDSIWREIAAETRMWALSWS
jgi:5-methylcytosine-specific restriction endonuclease McrA